MVNTFIRKLECRVLLSDADKKALTRASAKARLIPAHEDLIRVGERPDQAYLIRSGFACRFKILPDGARCIMAHLIPGDICDVQASLLGPMDHSIGTLSTCEVVAIPCETLTGLMASSPTLNRALQWAGMVDTAILREWLVSMGRRSGEKRVAHLFCELMMRLDAVGLVKDASFMLPVTQVELADTAGMTSVHVSRVLRVLRAQKLIILKGKRLTIPDPSRLKAFADFDPS